jgi:hypothetical protein
MRYDLWMKRFRRRLLNSLAVLSLLLCAASVVQWIRSYGRLEMILWVHDLPSADRLERYKFLIFSVNGGLLLGTERADAIGVRSVDELLSYYIWHPHGFELSSEIIHMKTDYFERPGAPHPFGLQISPSHGRYMEIDWWNVGVSVPYWLMTCVLAVLPAYRF